MAEIGSADMARALVLNAAMQRMERVFMILVLLVENLCKEPEASRIRCLANNTILGRSLGGALAL